jgi:hypothetical protein
LSSSCSINPRTWGFCHVLAGRHLLRCRKCPAAAEYGKPAEQRPLRFAQELITPVERGTQRLVAFGRSPAAADQQLEAIGEAGRELLGSQELQARGSELDGQGDSVNLTANLRDRCYIRLRWTKIGRHRDRAVRKQADGFDLRQGVDIHFCCGIGQGHSWDREDRFTLDSQRLPARGKDAQRRTCLQQLVA